MRETISALKFRAKWLPKIENKAFID